MSQPVFALAERGDPTTDGCHMLAEVEVEAFDKRLSLSRFLSGMMRL